jgi:uncharacterized membrane protein YphA (DoxX/SURF4 family)
LAAVITLVALRLCVGWHFYKEGVKHQQDPSFSSAGFLAGAVGPWADYYHDLAGADLHRWDELMARPLEDEPQTATSEADKKGDEKEESAVPADAPYAAWAEQTIDDWDARLHAYLDNFQLQEEQRDAAAAAFEKRKDQLLEYLDAERDALVDYRHEISRLEKMENAATATEVPYQQERIAAKRREVAQMAAPWKAEVRGIEDDLATDLHRALALDESQQREARGLFQEDRLAKIDKAATYLTLGVGACLMLGFFTRVASVAGAAFLLAVISTQPPWVAGAAPVYYQAVELVALLVLAAVGAGRWGGLDFFTYSLFRGCCSAKGSE